MPKKRREHSAQFKIRVALEAAKEQKTISELASEYAVHPTLVREWKKHLINGGEAVFQRGNKEQSKEDSVAEAELYEQIGRLKMELEWVKKKLKGSVEAKRQMIEPQHAILSIRRQCHLIGLNRASYYLEPGQESPFNLHLMRLIDEQYLRTPFYGYPRMTVALQQQGLPVNRKRVARLMQKMGLQALFPKRNLSQAEPGHQIYP
jgi:putative transposase